MQNSTKRSGGGIDTVSGMAKEILDVVVVGSGPGGGIATYALCQQGLKVGLVEAGRRMIPGKDYNGHGSAHKDWEKRLAAGFKTPHWKVTDYQEKDHFVGVGDNPRHGLLKALGGRSLCWAGHTLRFGPGDFAQWPIGYDEVAPYYARAERMKDKTASMGELPDMDKRQLSERDICTKFITPALELAGWDITTQVREEFPLTKGRIIVRGKLHTRAQNKRADYVLFHRPNIPIAVIEAKDNKHSLGDGMQQGLGYAEMLQVPFVFSSNGDGFLFHNKIAKDGVIERELALHELPSPDVLWQWWAENLGLNPAQSELVSQDYYSDGSNKSPRYYQLLAINKTIEAIAKGQNRILLVMATGTGKTYTAFRSFGGCGRQKPKSASCFWRIATSWSIRP